MRIKTKLTLGVGLLFILIVLLGLVGAIYIHFLKNDTENILLDNYNSVIYSKQMLQDIESQATPDFAHFEEELKLQELNATEEGEQKINKQLREHFQEYRNNGQSIANLSKIRNSLLELMSMNMQAIEQKSQFAQDTANRATVWIAVTGTACFIIAFTLLVNLPSNISNPISELTHSIQKIAATKYDERVHFEDHNEFGDLAKSFNTMAEKLEEYNSSNLAQLMRQKKRIEALINNMQDPVIGLDENWKVIFANEEACKVTGLSELQMIGFSSRDLALENDLIRLLLRNLERSGDQTAETLKIMANGKEGYYSQEVIHIEVIPTGEWLKELVGHVLILRNITEYKELDFAKTRFIATVSHEFKTPIASMKLSLQLLENERIGMLNKEQQNLVTGIQDDANRLLKITAELLNMTQVESGNIQLNIHNTAVDKIVDYAIMANQAQADLKGIKLVKTIEIANLLVLADAEKTAWVMTNLLTNAINYSHEQSDIQIQVYLQGDAVVFSVKDFGIGIPPEYLSKVFDRYFRVPGTHREGTGLGLAISKEFIEAQGGSIAVHSEYGVGSEFVVVLIGAV
ncbi:ATP-binding protein [Flavobacterium sp. NKUCC04_CG]|uniref:ATP-binding protein n=1 Tax=Flavobacterium sp. NKUCC04_CG TaxID=2842121 RepID=UPI001C5B5AF1|nr:ATP-binding protein [Flavobacterium sp. NKUCC04_CG]MBW3519134.1 HAMP domain-containing protein [Flavobacterium sp. NKUCC04_CG]